MLLSDGLGREQTPLSKLSQPLLREAERSGLRRRCDWADAAGAGADRGVSGGKSGEAHTKLSLPSSPCENPCLENCGWQGVRLLEFDPVSFELLDAHTYTADLHQGNAAGALD